MTSTEHPSTRLHIGGVWRDGTGDRWHEVLDPASGQPIARLPLATAGDLDQALASASAGFDAWRQVPPVERCRVMRIAAEKLRERADAIAALICREQGKRLSEAKLETVSAAEVVEWFAEEGRRSYGRVVPARGSNTVQLVVKEPVGPVAAFTPWNFPINQAVRKIAPALAAGCSIVVKGPEEAPSGVAALVQAFLDAGVPGHVINLVYGDPPSVSRRLIEHPAIRKVSFTGSTVVGKQLAALAGANMKRVTMELGGHAPAIVTDDADLALAVKLLAVQKFWNAGQACISPSRILVQRAVYGEFVSKFVAVARGYKVGSGFDKETRMGPLANPRRLAAMEHFVNDALRCGARLETGGERVGQTGYFFAPTVLSNLDQMARLWNEEPFGPIAAIAPYDSLDEAIVEANRLPYGLAAYVFTRSQIAAHRLGHALQAGMIAINNINLGLPEMPFGGVRDSGYGSEGGSEALEAYFNTKFIGHVVH